MRARRPGVIGWHDGSMVDVQGLRRHPLTLAFAVLLTAAEVGYEVAPEHVRATVSRWSSTNVANLTHEPFGALITSAFVVEEHRAMWLVLAIASCAALESRTGWRRTLIVLGASHVVGTLVSEGIVWWRVDHGALPVSARHLDDVGVSYVVVGSLGAVLVACAVRSQILAAVVLAALAAPLLKGITELDVTAVGHLSAAVTGAAGGLWVVTGLRSKQAGNKGTREARWNRKFRSARTLSQQ